MTQSLLFLEYQSCNCLAIDEITKDFLEEVVDSKGFVNFQIAASFLDVA